MQRSFWLELAASGVRFPIGTDLVLHEEPDPEAVVLDGTALGKVVRRAAETWHSRLGVPLMNLRLEKADLLAALGIPETNADTFHFEEDSGEGALETVKAASAAPFARRNQAHIDAIRYIARETPLTPIGMAIGPFSLMTKLLRDPITAVMLAGMGSDDPQALAAARSLALAEEAVARSVEAQIAAGAAAIIFCEPAANRVYISPRQIERGSDTFERFVMQPNLRLKQRLERHGVDLIFHDCGETTTFMVREIATRLRPVMLSLGSSRRLWEDAQVVPPDVVLYGNLPTKSFYSDSVMPPEKVASLTAGLLGEMRRTGHPFILGSECDVLDVPESRQTIRRKVEIMMNCRGPEPAVRQP